MIHNDSEIKENNICDSTTFAKTVLNASLEFLRYGIEKESEWYITI